MVFQRKLSAICMTCQVNQTSERLTSYKSINIHCRSLGYMALRRVKGLKPLSYPSIMGLIAKRRIKQSSVRSAIIYTILVYFKSNIVQHTQNKIVYALKVWNLWCLGDFSNRCTFFWDTGYHRELTLIQINHQSFWSKRAHYNAAKLRWPEAEVLLIPMNWTAEW